MARTKPKALHMDPGVSVIVADPDLVVSAWLVAETVTVCCVVMLDGAVYSPEEFTEPTPAGLIDHETAVSAFPLTVAENC